MTPLFKKLQFKSSARSWALLPPPDFEAEMAAMAEFTAFSTDADDSGRFGFAIAFVKTLAEIDLFVPKMVEQLTADGLFWLAYPKAASKKHRCEFNRDTGWELLGQLGFEPVRAVAIDEDWSALRFRRADLIKKMTRSVALSEVGKEKIGK